MVGLLVVVAAPLITSTIFVFWNDQNSGLIIHFSPKHFFNFAHAVVLLLEE